MAPPSPSPSWSDIPLEVAGLFLRRLPVHVDRVRFAAVCPQWRAAAREVPLPSPLPLLALPDGTAYSLPESKPLRFPSCTGYTDACGNWLAFKTEDGACFLRDPFSNATLTLPQLFRFHRRGESETQVSWVEIEEAPVKLTTRRLVFCSAQLIATFVRFVKNNKVLHTRLAVCQPGATWWSVHMDRYCLGFDDMTFHQGQLYLTSVNQGCLLAIDISVDHTTGDPWVSGVRQVLRIVIPPAISDIHRIVWLLSTHYLVESESDGALLMVRRKTYIKVATEPRGLAAGVSIPPGRIEFEVFRADFQRSKWTKVTTVGDDQVLFLRRQCSRFVCISPEQMPGDRIVFLEKEDSCIKGDSSASDSCKVYDMRDGTVSPFVPSVHWERGSVAATWLFPPV